MTSGLDLSNSQVNREWIDEWGSRVRGSRRKTTYFLHHAPPSCRCAMPRRYRVTLHSTTPHHQKPTNKKKTHELTTNYRISEGQNKGWACSDFKIQRKLKYLIKWSMPAPLQKYELSSMKWASNGELSTHDIHKLLNKMSQAQAFDRQTRCLEPIESPK